MADVAGLKVERKKQVLVSIKHCTLCNSNVAKKSSPFVICRCVSMVPIEKSKLRASDICDIIYLRSHCLLFLNLTLLLTFKIFKHLHLLRLRAKPRMRPKPVSESVQKFPFPHLLHTISGINPIGQKHWLFSCENQKLKKSNIRDCRPREWTQGKQLVMSSLRVLKVEAYDALVGVVHRRAGRSNWNYPM